MIQNNTHINNIDRKVGLGMCAKLLELLLECKSTL